MKTQIITYFLHTTKQERNKTLSKYDQAQEMNQYRIILIISIIMIATWFSFHDAYAISLGWIPGNFTTPIGFSIWSGGPLPQNPPLVPNQFEVTDGNYSNNGIIDKINVLVNSTTDPSGITLTLTEFGDTGHFYNTNFIFSNGTSGVVNSGSTQTIGISGYGLNTDPNVIEKVISNSSAPNGVWIVSSSDFNGIFLNLTETGPNTGIFTAPLKFTSGTSVDGSAIHANPGDVISIVDLATMNGWSFNFDDTTVEIVGPNSDGGLGALPAHWNDVVNVVYKGVVLPGQITNTADPGGGGGGLIRPSLVLDVVGGSHFIISPPSFGGGYFHFPDGLSIIQGISKTIHDISHYNQDIPLQVLVKDKPVNMTFKTFQSYNPNGLVHMGLFLIPPKTDMMIPNSIASISWDRNAPMELTDPEHILSNASVSISSDGVFQYTHFSFIPTKSYDQMSFLARAWNDHHYSRDVRIYDDPVENTSAISVTLPPGTTKYENFDDLLSALEKDGFHKPSVMSHIHDSSSVFGSSEAGQVFWLYDTKNQTVTLVISDKDGNEIGKTKSSLDPITSEKKGDYKFMHFTTKQLNRWNEEDMKHMMGIEASKAMFSALENGMMPYRNWSSGN